MSGDTRRAVHQHIVAKSEELTSELDSELTKDVLVDELVGVEVIHVVFVDVAIELLEVTVLIAGELVALIAVSVEIPVT